MGDRLNKTDTKKVLDILKKRLRELDAALDSSKRHLAELSANSGKDGNGFLSYEDLHMRRTKHIKKIQDDIASINKIIEKLSND